MSAAATHIDRSDIMHVLCMIHARPRSLALRTRLLGTQWQACHGRQQHPSPEAKIAAMAHFHALQRDTALSNHDVSPGHTHIPERQNTSGLSCRETDSALLFFSSEDRNCLSGGKVEGNSWP